MDDDLESLGCRIILTQRSVLVIETLTRPGQRPFRRVIEEFDSTNGKYDNAMQQARAKLRNLRH